MAEVTTGSLAQGEQPDTVIVRLGTLWALADVCERDCKIKIKR